MYQVNTTKTTVKVKLKDSCTRSKQKLKVKSEYVYWTRAEVQPEQRYIFLVFSIIVQVHAMFIRKFLCFRGNTNKCNGKADIRGSTITHNLGLFAAALSVHPLTFIFIQTSLGFINLSNFSKSTALLFAGGCLFC